MLQRELDIGDPRGRLPLAAIANGGELVLSRGQSLASAANVGRSTAGTGDAGGALRQRAAAHSGEKQPETEVQRQALPDVSLITSSN